MSSEIPPTDYFSGITFNPDFYQSSSSDYLTASTGQNYFLTYPTAQGSETISALKTSSIESSAPTTAMTLLSNQTANLTMATAVTGTIRLGAYTTTSTHIGNIDHQNNNINNASAPSAGSLGLGTSQTDGILNIGTGVRTTTGAINIGTGANTAIANAINIGSNSSAVKVNGSLTIGTNAPTAAAVISSTGAISGTTITGSGLITGSSFQNTNGSSTISSTGLIGGSALQIANTGSITVGGLAAITNGINVSGNIASTAGTITAGSGLIGAYQNTSSTPSATITTAGTITGTTITASSTFAGAYQNKSSSATASISTAGDILGISLSSGTGAIIGGTITASGLILANGGLTVPAGQTLTNNASFINTGAVTGAGLIVSGANNITLGTGTSAPIAGQIGYIQTTTYSAVTMQATGNIKTVMSITLAPGVWIITGAITMGSTQNLTKGTLSFGNTSRSSGLTTPDPATDSAYGNTGFYPFSGSGDNTPNITVYASSLTSATYYLNVYLTYTTAPTYETTYSNIKAMRIA